MIIDIVTIFPEFFDTFLGTSIIKRALESKLVEINLHQLRDYSHNKHEPEMKELDLRWVPLPFNAKQGPLSAGGRELS